MNENVGKRASDGGAPRDATSLVEEEATWLPLDCSWDDATEQHGYGNIEENAPVIGDLPAQLHPAVSLGMRRVSSCYFSIQSGASDASNSVADLLSLLEETSMMEDTIMDDSRHNENVDNEESQSVRWNASDVLYHDIMMHVFTFLDAPALAAFSETGRRPNFECFYFLQLQLQRAALVDSDLKGHESGSDSLGEIGGVGCLSRLASMDREAAMNIVEEYSDSNSTLREMPLSHSLAYIRHVLRRNGFRVPEGSPPNAIAGAAVVIALMGAASYMGGASPESMTNVLPNTLLKVGLAGSLMRHAARKMSDADTDEASHGPKHSQQGPVLSMRDAAEQMARMMQEMPSQMLQQLQSSFMRQDSRDEQGNSNFPLSIAARMYTSFSSAHSSQEEGNAANRVGRAKTRRSQRSHRGDVARLDQSDRKENEMMLEGIQEEAMMLPLTPNPYEHLEIHPQESGESNDATESSTDTSSNALSNGRKMPSGCVGAYSRAVRQSASQVTRLLKDKRRANFESLSISEQLQVSTAFIDACSSDDTLSTVKDFVQKRNVVDVDGFYAGSDGSETCALHTAAFNGACRVLEFLCGGIDEHDKDKDGGLCDVNLKDSNGWTALHFAAGANSVEAVKILAGRGAQLAVEAANGYTPYHWAQRLSNDAVAQELQKLGADRRFLEMESLSAIASRFFSLIPAH
jgi:hypothetical protein